MEPNHEPETEPVPETQAEAKTEPAPGSDSGFEVESPTCAEPERESEIPGRPELVQTAVLSAKPGIWSNICALLRRFFRSGNC